MPEEESDELRRSNIYRSIEYLMCFILKEIPWERIPGRIDLISLADRLIATVVAHHDTFNDGTGEWMMHARAARCIVDSLKSYLHAVEEDQSDSSIEEYQSDSNDEVRKKFLFLSHSDIYL
jgi:hypothetical protein